MANEVFMSGSSFLFTLQRSCECPAHQTHPGLSHNTQQLWERTDQSFLSLHGPLMLAGEHPLKGKATSKVTVSRLCARDTHWLSIRGLPLRTRVPCEYAETACDGHLHVPGLVRSQQEAGLDAKHSVLQSKISSRETEKVDWDFLFTLSQECGDRQ